MNKTKITNNQLFALTICNSIGVALIAISAVIAAIAKHDAWITGIITTAFGTLIMLMYWLLGSKYPGRTFVFIINDILGKPIGFIVSICYVFFYIIIGCHLPWYTSQFVTISAMPKTPTFFIGTLFMIVVIIAELYGIETIGRASEIFLFIILILFILAIILVIPNSNIENIKPVLEYGATPILKSSVLLLCFTTVHLVTMMGVYPYNIENIKEAKKSFLKGYLLAGFIIFTTITVSILVLGANVSSKMQYPSYVLAKEINVGTIFTRLEFLIAIVWICAIFIIGTMFFHASVISLSEVVGLKNYKKIVIPLGLIMIILAEVILPNIIYYRQWIDFVWIPYGITFGVVVPFLLLLVFYIKKWVIKAV